MRSKINYPGAKNASGIYQRIISIMPKHEIYIEAFAGSAAIMRRKEPATVQLGYDIDTGVIRKYCDGVPGQITMANSIKYLDTSATLLNAIHEHYARIMIYCDPPYLITTRRTAARIYREEMTAADHSEFLDVCRKLRCYIIISCYDNTLYDMKLKGWNKLHMPTTTRKGAATETIYYNFPDSLPRHQYNYVGDNFRDRAAIKGRVKRNVKKLLDMPDIERVMIMEALTQKITMLDRQAPGHKTTREARKTAKTQATQQN